MKNNKGLKIYHGQADKDIYADKYHKSEIPGIATSTMKDITDAYKEFMQELLLESQEAY